MCPFKRGRKQLHELAQAVYFSPFLAAVDSVKGGRHKKNWIWSGLVSLRMNFVAKAL